MKKILSLVAAIIIAATTFAKESELNEVTLTTIGTAPSKEQAVNQALRSAIEQAFGTFISANTKIVNDALTKDEIVSLSSGNIKNYEELSCATLSNGNTTVSLRATVSIQKLTTYAKSHGSQCEFAGNTFAQNMKLRELYRQNEAKAIDNLLEQLELMMPYAFQYSIAISGEPQEYTVYENKNKNRNSYYKVPVSFRLNATENSGAVMQLITTTLSSVSLSEAEQASYRSTNTVYYPVTIANSNPPLDKIQRDAYGRIFDNGKEISQGEYIKRYHEKSYYFRNEFPLEKFCIVINSASKFNVYAVLDNSKMRCQCIFVDRQGYQCGMNLAEITSKYEKKISIMNSHLWAPSTRTKSNAKKKNVPQKTSTVVSTGGYVLVNKENMNSVRGFEIEHP